MLAQFLIEQKCPQIPRQHADTWPPLPICVWIDFDNHEQRIECGGKSWPVETNLPAETQDGKKLYMRSRTPGACPAVCEHMGRVIE